MPKRTSRTGLPGRRFRWNLPETRTGGGNRPRLCDGDSGFGDERSAWSVGRGGRAAPLGLGGVVVAVA